MSPKKRARPVAEHISSSRHLRDLQTEAHRLDAATRAMRAALGTDIAAHASVARSDNREIVLVTDAAVWATRLRFAEADIAAAIAPQTRPGARPRVRVLIQPPRAERPPAAGPQLSARAAATIAQVAVHLEDERLRKVLLRLASRKPV